MDGGTLNWGGDPQVAAKNAISDSGIVGTSWSMNIAATSGKTYQCELLSCWTGDNGLQSSYYNRYFNIAVNGVSYVTDLSVSFEPDYATVYKFNATAGTNGITLAFTPGSNGASGVWGNPPNYSPWVNAVAMTPTPEPSAMAPPAPWRACWPTHGGSASEVNLDGGWWMRRQSPSTVRHSRFRNLLAP